EVEGHRLGLERLDDFGGRELDDVGDVLAAGLRLGDDLDEQRTTERVDEGGRGHGRRRRTGETKRSGGKSEVAPPSPRRNDKAHESHLGAFAQVVAGKPRSIRGRRGWRRRAHWRGGRERGGGASAGERPARAGAQLAQSKG